MRTFDVKCLWPSCRCPIPSQPAEMNMSDQQWAEYCCKHGDRIPAPATPPTAGTAEDDAVRVATDLLWQLGITNQEKKVLDLRAQTALRDAIAAALRQRAPREGV